MISREHLENSLREKIAFSIGLPEDKKDELLKRLPTLSDEQLSKLIGIFEAEEEKKSALLEAFFLKNPRLFSEYEQLEKDRVNGLYHAIETEEKTQETQRMQALLSTPYGNS